MIRNNQGIKGRLVREEAGSVYMRTYSVEEFRGILGFQLNRHGVRAVLPSMNMNVGFRGVFGLYLFNSPRN